VNLSAVWTAVWPGWSNVWPNILADLIMLAATAVAGRALWKGVREWFRRMHSSHSDLHDAVRRIHEHLGIDDD
jgi:hypothetical protein